MENEDKQIRLVPVEGPEKNDKKGDSLKEQIDYESDEASEEEQQLQEDRCCRSIQFSCIGSVWIIRSIDCNDHSFFL